MGAYMFYAAAAGFLAGVFLHSIFNIPLWFSAIEFLLALGWGGAYFVLKRNRSSHLLRRICASTSIVLVSFLVGAVRTSFAPTTLPATLSTLLEKSVTLEGTIVVPVDQRESNDLITVEVERNAARTRILGTVSAHSTLHVGDRVRISGTLKKPEAFASAGGRVFRYDQFLAKDGIFTIIQPAYAKNVGRDPNPWLACLRALEGIKNTFVRAIQDALPEPESALAIGITAGGKQGLGKQLIDAFTVAGMLQIVVLSGYNVMIVAESVLALLGSLPKRIALATAAIVIALFVLAAGAGSSAVRAGVMALIALTARATHRTYDVLRALFAALILMLLWNPLLLAFDPGLQLSFMATLGLILGSNLIEVRLSWIGSSTLREMTATTLSAQIAVLPLLLYESGNLSLVAVPANLLAMPVIPIAMALSAIAAGCALLLGPVSPFLSIVAGIPAYVPLAYVINVAEYAARVPFANVIIPAFSAWLLIPAYSALGWLVFRFKNSYSIQT
jgi:competence protein ComEC